MSESIRLYKSLASILCIVIGAVVPLHDWRSTVYKLLNLFPLCFGDNGFVAVLYDFPLLPRNDVVSVGTYPFLVRFADNVCALVKGIAQIVEMREPLHA